MVADISALARITESWKLLRPMPHIQRQDMHLNSMQVDMDTKKKRNYKIAKKHWVDSSQSHSAHTKVNISLYISSFHK